MGPYLQWYPPDQATIHVASLYDSSYATTTTFGAYLTESDQNDTWPIVLSMYATYSVFVTNTGFSGVWTNAYVLDLDGNLLRWDNALASSAGNYNGGILGFSPNYDGVYWLVIDKYFDWDRGSYSVLVTDSARPISTIPIDIPVRGAGGPGSDFAQLTDHHNTYNGNEGDDTVLGMGGNDTIYGDNGNDDLNGNVGNDWIHGDLGADVVRGGQGDDWVAGDYMFGAMIEAGGNDWHVNGNQGNDIVYGGGGDDRLYGGPDFDRLYGGFGNDTLSGDLGDDSLYGNEGADRFDFRSESGQDTVFGFDGGAGDRIWIEADINGSGISGFDDLAGRLTQEAGGARLDLGAGNSVLVAGAQVSWIWAGVVEFG